MENVKELNKKNKYQFPRINPAFWKADPLPEVLPLSRVLVCTLTDCPAVDVQ